MVWEPVLQLECRARGSMVFARGHASAGRVAGSVGGRDGVCRDGAVQGLSREFLWIRCRNDGADGCGANCPRRAVLLRWLGGLLHHSTAAGGCKRRALVSGIYRAGVGSSISPAPRRAVDEQQPLNDGNIPAEIS